MKSFMFTSEKYPCWVESLNVKRLHISLMFEKFTTLVKSRTMYTEQNITANTVADTIRTAENLLLKRNLLKRDIQPYSNTGNQIFRRLKELLNTG